MLWYPIDSKNKTIYIKPLEYCGCYSYLHKVTLHTVSCITKHQITSSSSILYVVPLLTVRECFQFRKIYFL